MRPLPEGRHLAVPHLVEDAARVLVAKVEEAPLPVPECAQRRGGELGGERQGLQARDDAVPAEYGHEPRQPRGRQAVSLGDGRREAQCREIDEAAPVRRPERFPVALEARRSSSHRSRFRYIASRAPLVRRNCGDSWPDNPRLAQLSDESRPIVSEPLGDLAGAWNPVPESSYGVVQEGADELHPFRPRRP